MNRSLHFKGRFFIHRPRIKSYLDLLRRIIISQNRAPIYRRHNGRDALLSINKNLFTKRQRAVFKLNIWILPDNNIPCRISTIKRIYQISDLRTAPNKRTLNLRNSNLTIPDKPKNVLNRLLFYRIFLCNFYTFLNFTI